MDVVGLLRQAGKRVLELAHPVVRLPGRWVVHRVLIRLANAHEMLMCRSEGELEIVLRRHESAWFGEARLYMLPFIAAHKITGRRPSRELAIKELRHIYPQFKDLTDRSKASPEIVANARVATYSLVRSLGAILRDEVDLEHPAFKPLNLRTMLSAPQRTFMLFIAMYMGLDSKDPSKFPALEMISKRVLNDADLLAEMVGEARK